MATSKVIMIVSCFVVVSLLLVTPRTADSQISKLGMTQSAQVETKPTNCEFNVSILTGADRLADSVGLMIIVARLGTGETKRDLNRRRLHNATTFLTEFGRRDLKTIITAEGERIQGYGRVELYIAGKLFSVLLARPNDDLAVGACSFDGKNPCASEHEKKLYPCLDKEARRAKRR